MVQMQLDGWIEANTDTKHFLQINRNFSKKYDSKYDEIMILCSKMTDPKIKHLVPCSIL